MKYCYIKQDVYLYHRLRNLDLYSSRELPKNEGLIYFIRIKTENLDLKYWNDHYFINEYNPCIADQQPIVVELKNGKFIKHKELTDLFFTDKLSLGMMNFKMRNELEYDIVKNMIDRGETKEHIFHNLWS